MLMLGCKGLITMNFRYGNTYFACADQRQTKLKPQVELFKSNFHPSVKTLKHIKKNLVSSFSLLSLALMTMLLLKFWYFDNL